MLAESEPVPGAVIAIPAHTPSNRFSCSSSATLAIAELPSPWRGIESSRPTSPQHISAIDMTEARLVPFLTPPSSEDDESSRFTPAAPAPSLAPDSESPSIIAASRSSSLGYACSALSYLREIGRSMFIATWCAWPTSGRNFLGSSRLMATIGVPVQSGAKRAFEWGGSYQHRTFHDADGPEVAVPPLHRVFLDEPVAAQQLHPVEPDLHALVGAQLSRQRDVAGDVLARGGSAGCLPGEEPHRLQLDRDVGDHERHRL